MSICLINATLGEKSKPRAVVAGFRASPVDVGAGWPMTRYDWSASIPACNAGSSGVTVVVGDELETLSRLASRDACAPVAGTIPNESFSRSFMRPTARWVTVDADPLTPKPLRRRDGRSAAAERRVEINEYRPTRL